MYLTFYKKHDDCDYSFIDESETLELAHQKIYEYIFSYCYERNKIFLDNDDDYQSLIEDIDYDFCIYDEYYKEFIDEEHATDMLKKFKIFRILDERLDNYDLLEKSKIKQKGIDKEIKKEFYQKKIDDCELVIKNTRQIIERLGDE